MVNIMATSSESSPDLRGLETPGSGVVVEMADSEKEVLPLEGGPLGPSSEFASSASTPPSPGTPLLPQQNVGAPPAFLNARAYQHEMFAESMKRNIILAMDTGSGKTQVAVLRIRAELDRTSAEKVKLLRGEDNIESWSNKETWNAALLNVRIVISTPQILLDAVAHAFVSMDRLSLIVFDEAHNSVKNNSCSKLMRNFYHPRKNEGLHVPHIMGLTASPIMNSKIEGIDTLEATLDAVCRSPSIHRSELLTHVKRPTMNQVTYRGNISPQGTPSYTSLANAFRSLDIREDPYILHLKTVGTDRSRRELQKAFIEHDTYIQKQMVSFCQRSKHLLTTLGTWAADFYIWQVITRFQQLVQSQDALMGTWRHDEKQYLLKVLDKVHISQPDSSALNDQTVTNKVWVLMSQLLAAEEDTVGIVFVRERPTASILSEIICSHPQMKGRFPKVGVMAGTSQHAARKRDIWDLFQGGNSSLDDFRTGNLNLLISTSVLEEGIDVPSCNLVICFERPANLKSFIQIRGRARERDSKLVVLLEQGTTGATSEWESLEAQMKRQYEDQDREAKRLKDVEESEAPSTEKYIVESTGAMLDHDNAKGHLDHFCSKMSPGQYIDSRPDYITQALDESALPFLTTTVLLPSYIPSSVRRAVSKGMWSSEKNSTKDAAFQAYVALHKAGLVNDHLLPLQTMDMVPQLGKRPAMTKVNGLLNVWTSVAQAWQSGGDEAWVATITLKDPNGVVQGEYEMAVPVPVPDIPPTPAYFATNEIWTLEFGPFKARRRKLVKDHTAVLLALNFRHRQLRDEEQHVVYFASRTDALTIDMVGGAEISSMDPDYLIRDNTGCPVILESILPNRPDKDLVQKPWKGYPGMPGFDECPEDVPWVTTRKWHRRVDFLHRPSEVDETPPVSQKRYYRAFPASWYKADTTHRSHARFGLLIPSIMHLVKIRLIAQTVSSSLLENIDISDHSLILTAICAPAANEATNYERLETLGDTILKLCTTMTVAAMHMDWPEGYLSAKKDGLVSNQRLFKAALDRGLDKFIINKSFTGLKWWPVYVDNVEAQTQGDVGPRVMSTKTLADVVESLIGASFYDGGLPKALGCISMFLSELKWKPIEVSRQMLYNNAPSNTELPTTLVPLEGLLGYTFRKKALLVEATTHASSDIGMASGCLERLELIGDAVLDHIIMGKLFPNQDLKHSDVHLLKTATVNGDLLGFMCLEHHIEQDQTVIVPPLNPIGNKSTPTIERSTFSLPLWKFMRHSAANIEVEQKGMTERHAAHREALVEALWRGKAFPWALLARLQIAKFYSDLLEAVIGAVYIDSGDMGACTAVITKFGILPLLERLIRDQVHIKHPKEELGHFVDCSTVKYVHYKGDTDMENGEAGAGRCKIMVGDRCLVDIAAYSTKLVTETAAAEMAMKILKEGRRAEAEYAETMQL
ncbi:RNase3 domain-containing protein [Plectosphaerella plurivora]|uniref:RNase3 domain-containing protein n=1 Tax=Plectosphaerella plurivora TaxID=936078 RepID=A0A9P8VDP7_9PEZI|nr:RNase3 domain-containing protein [Plectosphaerella plurivora]